ncbi:hypothetical protein L6164_025847 [Bauhinia variegata]|uniref:Uncharacterized protein n=1 Tax=Bauhinia variegata TaxID=167791 RepID=A0ACB9M265_BAUVA|nr:hypothetical protein L6164_025847 [Bauhinia variegata]
MADPASSLGNPERDIEQALIALKTQLIKYSWQGKPKFFPFRLSPEYLSFSLIYNNGEQSFDLICKDKAETELWFEALKTLIPTGQRNSVLEVTFMMIAVTSMDVLLVQH